jgi:hypothetical protein
MIGKDSKRANVNRIVASPNCVTIFGGGVAGLTAAHELVERGFRVQVWESRGDGRRTSRGPELGGMARTQWASVPWAPANTVARVLPPRHDWAERRASAITDFPHRFYAGKDGLLLDIAMGRTGVKTPRDCALEMLDELELAPHVDHLYCEVFDRQVSSTSKTRTRTERQGIADAIGRELQAFAGRRCIITSVEQDRPYKETLSATILLPRPAADERKVKVTIANVDNFPEDLPAEIAIAFSFRVRERWIPGEHGFRFFPSFYHHLFDTMARTPLLEPVPKLQLAAAQERAMTVNANPDRYTETGRTTFDNLRPTTKLAFGFADGRWPVEFSRSLPRSFEDLYHWLEIVFEGREGARVRGLGFTIRDTARFQLKIIQFLTSGKERRRDYEKMSWLEFLGGEQSFSPTFVEAISNWPEALVAMRARDVDARTHGAVLCQLALDNLRPPAYRDGTLNGPTSEAWIKHWKRYLEAQGVEFIHGKLEGFRVVTVADGQDVVWPEVRCYEPRYPDAEHNAPLLPGYFVLALPAGEAKRVAKSYMDAVGSATPNRDLAALAKQRLFGDDGDLDLPRPRGQLRHMIGIQYYFDEDISWLDGHAYFAGSPWGLSSISQVRFWQEKHDWEHGYRGVLSVVISIMDRADAPVPAGGPKPKAVWDCSPDEIAEEAWRQIRASLGNAIPEPRYWHLDDDIKPRIGGDGRQNGYDNTSPYQINLPGFWDERPGDLERPDGQRYCALDGVVCAGTHMKTFTRLTTMEAANESARHAANSILHHANVSTRRSPCGIWPIEEREVEDFKLLREIDDELHARGLGHFVEILELDRLVTHGLRGTGNHPLTVGRVLRELRALVHAHL